MSLTERIKSLSKKANIAVGVVAAVVVAALAAGIIVFARSSYLANTMRLLRIEGTVNIEDSNGGSKPVTDYVRFKSGDALNTGNDGLASVGLDNAKVVTLQNDSRAEFSKKGKKLELRLTKGSLFFNVMEKLKDDETFEIKTSTMTAGIRGTSGLVYYDPADAGRETLAVTDGVVEVTATNKDTGETKSTKVSGGQRVKVYLYSDRTVDSIVFKLDEITEDDLAGFGLAGLADDDALMDRVSDYNKWNKDKLKQALRSGANSEKPVTEATTTASKPTETSKPTEAPEPTEISESAETCAPTSTTKPKATATPKPTAKPTKKTTASTSKTDPSIRIIPKNSNKQVIAIHPDATTSKVVKIIPATKSTTTETTAETTRKTGFRV